MENVRRSYLNDKYKYNIYLKFIKETAWECEVLRERQRSDGRRAGVLIGGTSSYSGIRLSDWSSRMTQLVLSWSVCSTHSHLSSLIRDASVKRCNTMQLAPLTTRENTRARLNPFPSPFLFHNPHPLILFLYTTRHPTDITEDDRRRPTTVVFRKDTLFATCRARWPLSNYARRPILYFF